MANNDLEYVLETLGITADDVAETMEKFKVPQDKAFAITLLNKASSPNLPAQPKAEMKYNPVSQIAESLTGGIGGAMSGATMGGPMGAAIGGVAGAALPLAINKFTDSPGEATSMNRILDLAAPGMGKGISMISKLGPTGKALTNTAANTLMAYLADSEDNKRSGTEGKNPLGRAIATGAIGTALSPLGRQAGKQLSNAKLADATTDVLSPQADSLEQGGKAMLTMWNKDPQLAKQSGTLAATPQLKKFVKDNPDKIYDYVLTPITGAKNQAELQQGVKTFAERFDALPKLLGGNKDDVMQGLRTSFYNSIAKSPNGERVANPDSFKMRLDAMGPQVVDSIMGKDSYEKLSMLSTAASKAGALGRFAIRMGDGFVTVAKMAPMDDDSKLTNRALDIGKVGAALSTPFSGAPGLATVGGIQAYELYKIGVDKLLNKTDKKTLAALSSGLMNSTSNSVVNKLTEWFEKNADKKERVPLEPEPPKLF